jgi:hypothetical protein
MGKEQLISMMVELMQRTLKEQSEDVAITATADSALIGPEAVMTSMGMVSFITDVESLLAQEFNLEVTLVSEQALSRRHSPFRSPAVLADYILELAGVVAPAGLVAEENLGAPLTDPSAG